MLTIELNVGAGDDLGAIKMPLWPRFGRREVAGGVGSVWFSYYVCPLALIKYNILHLNQHFLRTSCGFLAVFACKSTIISTTII